MLIELCFQLMICNCDPIIIINILIVTRVKNFEKCKCIICDVMSNCATMIGNVIKIDVALF